MKTCFGAAVIFLGMLACTVQSYRLYDKFWLDTASGITRRYGFNGKGTDSFWYVKESCKAIGGYALTLNNAREANWINSKAELHLWVGPNKGGVYNWVVDESMNYTYDNWNIGSPALGGYNCVRFWYHQTWHNFGCGHELVYSCKKVLENNATCENGWKKREKFCYKFSANTDKKTWQNARSTCVALGADLVWIGSKEENKWVRENAQADGWLGLNDLHRKHQWVWSKFGNYDSYSYIVPVDTDNVHHIRNYQCYWIARQGDVWKMHKGQCLYPQNGYICEMPAKDIDGSWGAWSDYSQCSISTCGGRGVLRSRRDCNDPRPGNNGKDCVGNRTRTILCNVAPCPPNTPVNGGWSEYGSYSTCSKTCGDGVKTRTRTCDNPAPALGGKYCTGSATERTVCNDGTPCTVVNGGWSDYGSYSACSKTCGDGVKTRIRTCDNPAPAYGGAHCSGSATETAACNERSCLVNGGWSDFTCTKTRSRTCNNPAPANGGTKCKGVITESVSCDGEPWNKNP